MKTCRDCVHVPICRWCADNSSLFQFQKGGAENCDMFNNDFDEVEEAVSNAQFEARQFMNEFQDDPIKHAFVKGRWSAFKDVMELMSHKGRKGTDNG